MNRRITLAAVAVILAVFGLSQSQLPEAAALVGTYLASLRQAPARHLPTLNPYVSATLHTDSFDY